MENNEQIVEQQEEIATAPNNNGKKPSKFVNALDSFFQISANKSSFRAETVGGLTTFFAMCYILIVNPGVMTGEWGPTPIHNAVFIATALGAIIGTLLMALYAKMPFAQAPGMGLNAFFNSVFVANGVGFAAVNAGSIEAYQGGMAVIFVAGLLFMLLSLTGLREKIAKAMPACLKTAITAGIGLFIAKIGLGPNGFGLLNGAGKVANMNFFTGGATWYTFAPILAGLIGFLMIGLLSKTKASKFNVIIAIISSTALFYLFNIGNSGAYSVFTGGIQNPIDAFKDFGNLGIGAAFKGFQYWDANIALNLVLLIITFCLVDMFDTLGTLQGAATEADMLDSKGNPKNLGKCLMADSTATVVGGIFGTSTVTTFVESAAGVGAGARTGFSSLIVAILFFVAMFLSPLAAIIPACAVGPALVYVGVLMLKNIINVDFKDMYSAIPAFLTVIVMPLAGSISDGIGVGMIAYMFMNIIKVLFSKYIDRKAYFSTANMVEGYKQIPTKFKNFAAKFKKGAEIVEIPEIEDENVGAFWSKDLIIYGVAILFILRFFMVTM